MARDTLKPPVHHARQRTVTDGLREENERLRRRVDALTSENARLSRVVSRLYRERHGLKALFSEGLLVLDVHQRVLAAMEEQSEAFQDLLDLFGITWEMVPQQSLQRFRDVIGKHTESALAMFKRPDAPADDEDDDGPRTFEGLAPAPTEQPLELTPEMAQAPITRRGGTHRLVSGEPKKRDAQSTPGRRRPDLRDTWDWSRQTPDERAAIREAGETYRRNIKRKP